MKMIINTIALFFLIGIFPTYANGAIDPLHRKPIPMSKGGLSSLDSIEQRIDKVLKDFELKEGPGASIAVLHEGKIIYSRGIGYSNLEYDIPIEKNTIFHVASVSKQFTAFSIAMLAKQGQLSLDEDIRVYLPELPDFESKITIKHLIHHTSGLRDQWDLLALAGWRLDDVITEEQILKLINNQKELNFKPGEEFLYSNTNYTLLAKIVERVTGEKFNDWTKKNIFIPLRMENSFFYDDHEKIVKNRAYSYAENGDKYKKQVLNFSTVGATSLFTTAEDLALWAHNFETIKVGNQAIMDQVHQTTALNNGKAIDYAFGPHIVTYKGMPMAVHGGADAGYRTYLARFPEQHFAIAVLSNLASLDPKSLAMKIVDICLADAIRSQHQLADYVGHYKLQSGTEFKIWLEHETLKMQVNGKNDIHNLVPTTNSQFEIPTLEASVIFDRDQNNVVFQLMWEIERKSHVAAKQPPSNRDDDKPKQEPSKLIIPKEILSEYQGNYEIQKPLLFTIWLEKDSLKAKVTGKRDVHTLVPISEFEFNLPTLHATMLFERGLDGNVYRSTYTKDSQSISMRKLSTSNILSEIDLSEYSGKYYSKELETFYSLVLKEGKIVAQHPRHSDKSLEVLDRDFLTSHEWFMKKIKVMRDAQQKILGIKVSSTRSRDIWFEKVD
jgi:CubicO group peptidase (beta-lactamase class C family)